MMMNDQTTHICTDQLMRIESDRDEARRYASMQGEIRAERLPVVYYLI